MMTPLRLETLMRVGSSRGIYHRRYWRSRCWLMQNGYMHFVPCYGYRPTDRGQAAIDGAKAMRKLLRQQEREAKP